MNNNIVNNESLQDAATNESSDYGNTMKVHIECAFINGANWQAERDKAIIDKLISAIEHIKQATNNSTVRILCNDALNQLKETK